MLFVDSVSIFIQETSAFILNLKLIYIIIFFQDKNHLLFECRVYHIEMDETKWLWGVEGSIILLNYGSANTFQSNGKNVFAEEMTILGFCRIENGKLVRIGFFCLNRKILTLSAKCLTTKAVWLNLGFWKCSHLAHLSYSFCTQDWSDP